MEENSGVKFQNAMVALARQWVGQEDGGSNPQQTVSIVVPDETLAPDVGVAGNRNALKTETYPLPRSVDEARAIIERFEHGADSLRSDEDVSDNVIQHMLNDKTSLLDERWLGTDEEERAAYVSELLYIHSKVMIVDDRRVIVSTHACVLQRDAQHGCRWAPPILTTAAKRKVYIRCTVTYDILIFTSRVMVTPRLRSSSRTRT
jgi:phospholipase D1/2